MSACGLTAPLVQHGMVLHLDAMPGDVRRRAGHRLRDWYVMVFLGKDGASIASYYGTHKKARVRRDVSSCISNFSWMGLAICRSSMWRPYGSVCHRQCVVSRSIWHRSHAWYFQ